MDSLPERLREQATVSGWPRNGLYNEAASELDRLGAQVEELKRDMDRDREDMQAEYRRMLDLKNMERDHLQAQLKSALDPLIQIKMLQPSPPIIMENRAQIEALRRVAKYWADGMNLLTEEEIAEWQVCLQKWGSDMPPGCNVLCRMAYAGREAIAALAAPEAKG